MQPLDRSVLGLSVRDSATGLFERVHERAIVAEGREVAL